MTSYFDLGSISCVPSPVVLGVSTNLIQFICNGGIVFFAMKMSSTEEIGFFLKNDCDCESIKFCNVYVCLKQQSLDYTFGTGRYPCKHIMNTNNAMTLPFGRTAFWIFLATKGIFTVQLLDACIKILDI